MAKMQGLAHAGIYVQDMERTLKFYNDVLDFETTWEAVVDEADGTKTKVAFAKNGDLTIEFIQVENPPKRDRSGVVDHVALAVEDIEAVAEMLRGRGVVFEQDEPVFGPSIFPKGAKWMLFRGPDDEHLEITEVLK